MTTDCSKHKPARSIITQLHMQRSHTCTWYNNKHMRDEMRIRHVTNRRTRASRFSKSVLNTCAAWTGEHQSGLRCKIRRWKSTRHQRRDTADDISTQRARALKNMWKSYYAHHKSTTLSIRERRYRQENKTITAILLQWISTHKRQQQQAELLQYQTQRRSGITSLAVTNHNGWDGRSRKHHVSE